QEAAHPAGQAQRGQGERNRRAARRHGAGGRRCRRVAHAQAPGAPGRNEAMAEPDDRPELPDELPVVPLRQFVVFPYMALPLFLARDRSWQAIDDALAGERCVRLVAQRDADLEEPDPDDLHAFGTVAMVMRSMRLPDGRVKALVQGLSRAAVESYTESDP